MKINTYPKHRDVLLKASTDIALEDLHMWSAYVDEMKQFADDHDSCIGLAANQVWERDTPYPSIFVMGMLDDNEGWKEFINPTILPTGKTIKNTESCLSRPGKVFIVKRSKNVAINYYDLTGKEHTEKYGGAYAQIIQHEMQHLSGSILKREWKRTR